MSSQKISEILSPIPPGGTADELMAFDELNKDTLIDLGTTSAAVKQLLDDLVAKKIRQEIDDALLAAWNKENPSAGTPAAPPAEPPAAVAPVPSGTVDLASKTQSPDGSQFKFKLGQTEISIPANYAPSVDDATPVVSADELEDWQWNHLALNNNLTYAINLDILLTGGGMWATKAAFLWNTPFPSYKSYESGEMKAQLRSTSQENLVVRNGILDTSLSGGYAGSTASLKFSYKANEASDWSQQTSYMSAWFVQWKCYVEMRDSLVLSSGFTTAIDNALATGDNDTKFSALMKVFDDYGHVVPDHVYLGGSLLFQRSLKYDAKGDKDSIANNLDVAVGVEATKDKIKPSGKITDESTVVLTAELLEEEIDFTAIGGDTSKNAAPLQWVVTTKSPALWRTIKQDGLTPITTYLDDTRQQAIQAVFDTKRKDAWCSADVSAALATRGADKNSWNAWLPGEQNEKLYLNKLLPIFAKDQLILLSNAGESGNSYLVARNYAASFAPDDGALDFLADNPRDLGSTFPLPDPKMRERGHTYGHCQPSPSLASGADSSYLHWRLEYVGRCTAQGDPLYWIVTSDNLWVLSAFEQMRYSSWSVVEEFRFASLYPYEEEKKRRYDDTPAKWNLFFADPTGRWGLEKPDNVSEDSDHFLLWNPNSLSFLGPHQDATSFRMYTFNSLYGPVISDGYTQPANSLGFTKVALSSYKGGRSDLEASQSDPQSPRFKNYCWLIQPS